MRNIEIELSSNTPLLITESEEDFAALKEALTLEIKPRGIIEQMYVTDIAHIVWEILRLRHCKVAIINTAFKDALSKLVFDLAGQPSWGTPKKGLGGYCLARLVFKAKGAGGSPEIFEKVSPR
jgi:hypothetical protein